MANTPVRIANVLWSLILSLTLIKLHLIPKNPVNIRDIKAKIPLV